MRIALISDIHGNAIALEAVLADIAQQGADRIVCLGDVATIGPQPRAVLDMLRECGCACILGNHDEFLLDRSLVHAYSTQREVLDAVAWCEAELSREQIAFVRGFDADLEITLDDRATLLLYHGSPTSNTVDILATTTAEDLGSLLGGHRATVMVGGHTHLQMLRQHRGALLVNPGSVGLPFKEYVAGAPPTILAHAEYAIVDAHHGAVRVTLQRMPLDRKVLRDAAAASRAPLGAALVEQYA